jgi:hypothetical protein
VRTARSIPGVTSRQTVEATSEFWRHAAKALARPAQSVDRTTTFRGPPRSGVKRSVTTWSPALRLNPGDASHWRSDSSIDSPGAANGRFVVPMAPANVVARCGIRLQDARTSRAATRMTIAAVPTKNEDGSKRMTPSLNPWLEHQIATLTRTIPFVNCHRQANRLACRRPKPVVWPLPCGQCGHAGSASPKRRTRRDPALADGFSPAGGKVDYTPDAFR